MSSQEKTSDIHWFPMRVTYSRELKAKAHLENLGIECFVPMRYTFVEEDGWPKRELLPALHNLIFVHSTQETITNLKIRDKEADILRYIMVPHTTIKNKRPEIMVVPDAQMSNFIKVASRTDDSVMFLDYRDVLARKGREVLIAEGPFAGVRGNIIRIQKNKRVVVMLEGLAAVAIKYTPSTFIINIETSK